MGHYRLLVYPSGYLALVVAYSLPKTMPPSSVYPSSVSAKPLRGRCFHRGIDDAVSEEGR